MQALLERIAHLNILVVGDLILDHYIWGDASRLSPEAPVPVVRVDRDTYTAGGAANVASNLRALGARATVAGVFGADADGARLAEILSARGVAYADAACRRLGVPTIVKTRVMCRRQQLCRLDREGAREDYALTGAAREALARQVAESDAVILSDYAKGVVTSESIRLVQSLARPGQLVALDPKPRPGLSFEGVSLLTPNKGEAFQLAGLEQAGAGADALAEALARIRARHAPDLLVVTLGAEGMLLCGEGRPGRQLPTAAREVFDVSGAGDTVIATLTAALAAGADLDRAAALANLAAGVVVGKLGTAVATPEEILAHAAAG